MITVSCTDEGEARDMADVLLLHLPPDRDYRVLLCGREYELRYLRLARGWQRQDKALKILAAAGRQGMTTRDLRVQLNRDGIRTAPATLYRWLNAWLAEGLVGHAGIVWWRTGRFTGEETE